MSYFILIENYIDEILKNEIQNKNLINLYFNIGKILSKKNNMDLKKLELYLKSKYGIIIGFTQRNFHNMITFYKIYKDTDIENLKNITWKNHLIILREKNKKELLEICLKNNLTKDELLFYIKNKEVKKYKNKENDEMLTELINLKKKLDNY